MKKSFFASIILLPLLTGATHAASLQGGQVLYDLDLIQGQNNTGDLQLDQPINRAEFMKVLADVALVSSLPTETFGDCFDDVTDQWFAAYVCWANSQGYVDGYPDGLFHPERNVNHAEALKMLSKVFHFDTAQFDDISTGEWFDTYYKYALSSSILSNENLPADGSLGAFATRGEVFEYVARAKALSDSDNTVFSSDMFASMKPVIAPTEPLRTLTSAEKSFLALLGAQLRYGYQKQITDSGFEMTFSMSEDDNYLKVTADLSTEEITTGTEDMLTKADIALDALLGFDATVDGEQMSLTVRVIGKIRYNEGELYLRLDDVEVVDVDAPVVVRIGLYEMIDEIALFEGYWQKGIILEAEELVQSDAQTLNDVIVKLLEHHFMYQELPLVHVTEDIDGQMVTYTVSLNYKAIPAFITMMAAEEGYTLNQYQIKNIMKENADLFQPFVDAFTLTLETTTKEFLIHEANIKVPMQEVQSPDGEVTILLDLNAEQSITYPTKEPAFVFPDDSEVLPLEALFDYYFPSANLTFSPTKATIQQVHTDVMKALAEIGNKGFLTKKSVALKFSETLRSLLSW